MHNFEIKIKDNKLNYCPFALAKLSGFGSWHLLQTTLKAKFKL